MGEGCDGAAEDEGIGADTAFVAFREVRLVLYGICGGPPAGEMFILPKLSLFARFIS